MALTSEGLQTADAADASSRERERLLAALSPDEVEQLDGAIHRLLDVMSADADGHTVEPQGS